MTCDYLKDLELNSYKHIPAFLAKVLPDDATSHEQKDIAGNCFGKIGIRTEFNYLSETSILASVTLSLSSHSSFFCIEHLQFSTTFRDFYKPQFQEGTTKFDLQINNLNDLIDIHKNGLRIFTYCANQFELLSSFISTSLLWIGGAGSSKYLPIFGMRPTDYQIDGNRRLIESVSGIIFEERVINRVNLHTSEMRSGDILISRKYSGHTTDMMLLSGGLASHAAMVLKDSSSSAVFVIDCFQSESGARKTLFSDWLQSEED